MIKEKVQLSDNKLLRNTLRVKWAGKLKSDKVELSKFYKGQVSNRRYIIKAELSLII